MLLKLLLTLSPYHSDKEDACEIIKSKEWKKPISC